ncbi:MAG: hypothetical protein Q9227_002724 [Pyrenula ochraceoflavens]
MSINFPQIEAEVLKRWDEIGAFQRQLELSRGRPPFTFYDGPPFATGLPHYGHLLASTIKDIIPRYWSMKGFHVERRFGWDTHGLPIEHQIDKKLGKSGRELVEQLGLEGYNRECRSIVLTFAEEWRKTIGRLGRWIDFDNDYKTMDLSFMESVWWVFKELYKKDQVYRDYRVMPYSTALATPLSNFEKEQNRKDTQDHAIVVSFPLRSDPHTQLLIWTTTPWTVPSNIAIAAHPDYQYIKIQDEKTQNKYIIMESCLQTLYKDPKRAKFKKLESFSGRDLLGLEYIPPFDYFYERNKDWWFHVINADYVKDDSGTGLVHQSPSFGGEDWAAATASGVISRDRLPPHPIDEKGCYTSEVPDYVGEYVRGPVEKTLIKHIERNGRLVVNGQVTHNVAFCPRSDTPLIENSVPAWFVKVTPKIPQMLENIAGSYWVPAFVKERRFASWIENSRDWNISRNRFWGTPIPIWTDDTFDEIVVIGSVAELKEKSGYEGEIQDLHRDVVDKITIPSAKGGVLKRIEEVFDCWFESGSMPYASIHYPFKFTDPSDFKGFPGDFIAEGLDQTRGWFYTLVVLGTHLFGVSPFRNCIVNGIVLAENGKKMSKRLKNYPDPMAVINSYGADALRLYLINSPVVRAEPLRFVELGVRDVVTRIFLPLWNSYQFFQGQVALLKKTEGVDFLFDANLDVSVHGNVMDRWIQARCQSLLQFVNQEMNAYRLYTVVPELVNMIDSLTNWYIRLNRRRLKGEAGLQSSLTGLNTLFEVLFFLIRSLAPFIPFLTDHLFTLLATYLPQSITKSFDDIRSVHFLPYPDVNPELLDPNVERKVQRMQNVIGLARISRERKTIGFKTPLKSLVVVHTDPVYLSDIDSLRTYICDELNIQDLELSSDEAKHNVQYSCVADWPTLGKKLRKDAQKVKKLLPQLSTKQVKDFMNNKSMTLDGIHLTEDDLVVRRDVPNSDNRNIETNTDNDVLTILDVELYPDLASSGLAREVINRIQRLRKKAGLVATDDVRMIYRLIEDPQEVGLADVFTSHARTIESAVRGSVVPEETANGPVDGDQKIIIEEELEVQKATFFMRFVSI